MARRLTKSNTLDYSIYIIKQNTPESKLLPHAGINRNNLAIVKWKGKKKYRGGFGKTPVEWRINDINDVQRLCETIVRILGNRKVLNYDEKRAFSRAEKTLEGIANAKISELKQQDIQDKKKKSIISLIRYEYPILSDIKCEKLATELSHHSFDSIASLFEYIKKSNLEIILAIEESRKTFCNLMKL